MPKFYIQKLVVTGSGKEPSVIDFCSGLNLIVGPSNTGKSYVLECIDYLFGFEEKKNKPYRFDKGLGYDCFKLYTKTANGTVIFERKLDSTKISISGTDHNFEHGEYSTGGTGKKRIRDIWLQMMGIDEEHKIYSSQAGKKQAFTWRSILHIFFVKQDDVSRTSPLLLKPSNYYSDTASKWALLFMISGKDADTDETPESKEIRKAKRTAVISYMKDTVKRLSLREKELMEAPIGNALDFQSESERILAEIEETQSQINASLTNSKKLMEEIYLNNGKLTECETISDRFSSLRSQYRSDIGRLTFIIEGEKGKTDLPVNSTCPFCDNKIATHENVSYVEAARAELSHIRVHLTDLEKAETDVNTESREIKARVASLEEEKERTDAFISDTLKPRISGLKQTLENYRRAIEIANEISIIRREENQLKAELFEKETEGDGLTLKYDYRQYYDHEIIAAFEDRLVNILKSCRYEGYSSARFSLETFDLEINGRSKSVAHGGGYCGLLNTVVALALLEYLCDKGTYAPGMLVIDSPVSQLSESEYKEKSETMKTSLFKYLLENHDSGQVIMIEQKEKMPDFKYDEYENVKVIEFTKNKEHGRYGFLNGVFDDN